MRRFRSGTTRSGELDIFSPTPPDGMSYQWNTLRLFGAEQLTHISFLMAQGWRFVPPERHPELPTEDGKIVASGAVLMERSTADTAEALSEEQRKAVEAMEKAEANRVGNTPHGFKVGDEVWDRRNGILVGWVAWTSESSNEFEVRLKNEWGGSTMSSGAGNRANPHLNWPTIYDMVKTQEEAKAFVLEQARAVVRVMYSENDEELAEMLAWVDNNQYYVWR